MTRNVLIVSNDPRLAERLRGLGYGRYDVTLVVPSGDIDEAVLSAADDVVIDVAADARRRVYDGVRGADYRDRVIVALHPEDTGEDLPADPRSVVLQPPVTATTIDAFIAGPSVGGVPPGPGAPSRLGAAPPGLPPERGLPQDLPEPLRAPPEDGAYADTPEWWRRRLATRPSNRGSNGEGTAGTAGSGQAKGPTRAAGSDSENPDWTDAAGFVGQSGHRRRRTGAVVGAIAVVTALLAAGGIGRASVGRRTPATRVETRTRIVAKEHPSQACAAAIATANAALVRAVRLQAVMREQSVVMDALTAHEISPAEAVRSVTPSLIRGAAESAMFDRAYADYGAAVRSCPAPDQP